VAAPKPLRQKRAGAVGAGWFSIGMGATCAMFVLGSLREILGNGTLFDGADSLLGSWAKCCASKYSIPIRRSAAGDAAAGRLYWPRHDAGGKIPYR
jgi:hypothetical protein